jgi:regulator of sigma E protease
MSALVSILGLALLILVHEAGHFFTARAVGMRPRKFYLGFPPALAKVKRNGIEYGVGAIPLGGYVKIPGMHRPAAQDLEAHLGRAVHEAPELGGPVARVQHALEREDFDEARGELPELKRAVEESPLTPPSLARAERGLGDVEDALAPDAYWRASSWKRILVIFAGPGTNIVFAIAMFTLALSMGTGAYRLGFVLQAKGEHATGVVDAVDSSKPAGATGLTPGDRIVAVNGSPVQPDDISSRIRASHGAPIVLTVQRDGRRVVLTAARPLKDKGETVPGAFVHSVRATGEITREIGSSLVGLVHSSGRDQISSPVGIVRGSSEAVRAGTQEYLTVLGLISLSLALLNLLPLLPLDGGHIAFSLIEGVRRRAVPRAVYERVSAVGIALVLLLFFLGLNNDLGG